jgi:hypothetical protein
VFVDLEVLKKRLNTYRTEGGHLTKVPDEILLEVLSAWEGWTGPSKGFFAAIGVNRYKMAGIIGKAKKLKRDGHFPADNFKEIKIAGVETSVLKPCQGIEMAWDGGKLIRFSQVDQLIDFLKKVA